MTGSSRRTKLFVVASSVSRTLGAVLASGTLEAAPPNGDEIQAPWTMTTDTSNLPTALQPPRG
jgi:hypothetical protein